MGLKCEQIIRRSASGESTSGGRPISLFVMPVGVHRDAERIAKLRRGFTGTVLSRVALDACLIAGTQWTQRDSPIPCSYVGTLSGFSQCDPAF